MRALFKVGFSLLVLAFFLIGASYGLLRAQGTTGAGSFESRMMASDKRAVGKDITSVELAGPIDLTLRYGPAPSLEILGEQRLLGNIETVQEGGVLHIGPRGILLRHRQPLKAVLVLPALANLTVDGSGESTVDGFSGEQITVQLDGSGSIKFNGRYRRVTAAVHGSGELEVDGGNSDKVVADLSGSGHLTLAGASRELRGNVAGSGELDAQHLRAEAVTVDQMGSGHSTVHARATLAATVSGSGDIDVYGNPSQRTVRRMGSGDVSFSDDE
jgi:hypothetical protein